VGLSSTDEQVLKILCQFLAMQIERSTTKTAVARKEQAIIETLELTSEVCTQRNFTGLYKKMREFMPKYFGFQAVGVLIYQPESKSIVFDMSLANQF